MKKKLFFSPTTKAGLCDGPFRHRNGAVRRMGGLGAKDNPRQIRFAAVTATCTLVIRLLRTYLGSAASPPRSGHWLWPRSHCSASLGLITSSLNRGAGHSYNGVGRVDYEISNKTPSLPARLHRTGKSNCASGGSRHSALPARICRITLNCLHYTSATTLRCLFHFSSKVTNQFLFGTN